jgi:hypothetical protein
MHETVCVLGLKVEGRPSYQHHRHAASTPRVAADTIVQQRHLAVSD